MFIFKILVIIFVSTFWEANDETIVISNGTYHLDFETAKYSWYREIKISGNQTISLPSEPSDISFEHIDTYVNPDTNELELQYSLIINSGPFHGYSY